MYAIVVLHFKNIMYLGIANYMDAWYESCTFNKNKKIMCKTLWHTKFVHNLFEIKYIKQNLRVHGSKFGPSLSKKQILIFVFTFHNFDTKKSKYTSSLKCENLDFVEFINPKT